MKCRDVTPEALHSLQIHNIQPSLLSNPCNVESTVDVKIIDVELHQSFHAVKRAAVHIHAPRRGMLLGEAE